MKRSGRPVSWFTGIEHHDSSTATPQDERGVQTRWSSTNDYHVTRFSWGLLHSERIKVLASTSGTDRGSMRKFSELLIDSEHT
jgi:hypothetical protein